ncbi:MAG TPA: cob(I)yrinic acid a,c-diamide adenosyltransferase [Nitrososphaera sp.]|jgi:cob(I)alamin adenosyltransferase|nr:cob(I)yrinic acid a,c-diamide adenosyltransferase [Nitrososphaera sp.]
MKIYTRTGDKGETGLIGGKRVPKSDPRIVAYGAVDELNSNIGVALAFLSRQEGLHDLFDVLVKVQNDLFVLGSDLADSSYPDSQHGTPRVEEKMASALEPVIDKFEEELEPISYFILPGGTDESSLLHQCRGVARRAETAVVALSKLETINPSTIVYLNRLSDLLFVAARLANKRAGKPDVAWRNK